MLRRPITEVWAVNANRRGSTIFGKTASTLVGPKTGLRTPVKHFVDRADALELLGAYDPLEFAAGAHLVIEHEDLETVTITVEDRPHQLLDGIDTTLGLGNRGLNLGGRLDPLAEQQLEQEGFLAVESSNRAPVA